MAVCIYFARCAVARVGRDDTHKVKPPFAEEWLRTRSQNLVQIVVPDGGCTQGAHKVAHKVALRA